MHIFLTGEKHIGKSTLVSKVLERAGAPVCGLRTVSRFEDGERVVYMVPAAAENSKNEHSEIAGRCREGHITEVHPEVFDDYGVRLLSNIKAGSLVVIDEIGSMERDAAEYAECVLKLLEREDIRVFGVLQKRADTPLARRLRNVPGIYWFEVTEDNRESLAEDIGKELL